MFGHTWSLGVEEQFYLIFPLLFWVGFTRMRLFVFALSALTLLSLVAFVVGTSTLPRLTYYLMPTRFWELAAGALLFSFTSGRTLPVRISSVIAPTCLLVVLGMFAVPRDFQAASTLGMVVATAGLIATAPTTWLRSVLSHPVIRYLGHISYSLYLWHWSVLSIARWTVGVTATTIPFLLLATFLLASLSYVAIEKPLRRGAGHGWRTVGLGFAVSAACLIIIYGGLGMREAIGLRALVAPVSTPSAFPIRSPARGVRPGLPGHQRLSP